MFAILLVRGRIHVGRTIAFPGSLRPAAASAATRARRLPRRLMLAWPDFLEVMAAAFELPAARGAIGGTC